MTKSIFLAAIFLPVYCLPSGQYNDPRGKIANILMKHHSVSEASIFPWVKLRNQPYRIYQRFAGSKEKYRKGCRQVYERVKGRYFRIRYKSQDGLFVEGVVAFPKGFDPEKKYPAMIFNHGNWEEGRRFTYCFTSAYEIWTRNGLIVFGPQYRGVNGGEGIDEFGGRDVLDVLQIINIAKELAFVDERNVFLSGNSRGGMMTYLALKNGAEVNAAIVNCGVTDVLETSKKDDVLARVISSSLPDDERESEYLKRSAVFWPEKLKVPLLILHGENDVGVPVHTVRDLAAKLEELGNPHKVVIYPNAGHCGEGYPISSDAEMVNWVKKYTKE